MNHHAHAEPLCGLARDQQRYGALLTAGVAADPNLYADDHVTIAIGHVDGIDRRQEPMVATFANANALRTSINAGKGNVEISKNPRLAARDHVIAKAGETAGTGATGIDQGRHRAFARKGFRIDAERRATRINMGMQIDQPRRHEMTGNIAFRAALQAFAHHRNMAVGKSHIGDTVDALRRVDDPAATQNEIMHRHGASSLQWMW